jgi:hypothetical protein
MKPKDEKAAADKIIATMPMKTPIKIERQLLVHYRQVARILGIPTARYVETYLKILLTDLSLGPLEHIANELFYKSYDSREQAEAAAERFEAFAVEQRLAGNGDAGTITTEVVEHLPDDWRVKAYYLYKAGWRVIASDLWGEDEDDEDKRDREGEEWKKD